MSKDDIVTAAFPVAASSVSVSSPASTSTTGIAACPSPYLRQGSQGDAVRSMQQRLSDLGYTVSVDGNFGPGTGTAVKACQGKNGLSDDGVVGPDTWAAIWRS